MVKKASALHSVDMNSIPLSGHTKVFKNGIHRLSAWWCARNQQCGEKADNFGCYVLSPTTFCGRFGVRPRTLGNPSSRLNLTRQFKQSMSSYA